MAYLCIFVYLCMFPSNLGWLQASDRVSCTRPKWWSCEPSRHFWGAAVTVPSAEPADFCHVAVNVTWRHTLSVDPSSSRCSSRHFYCFDVSCELLHKTAAGPLYLPWRFCDLYIFNSSNFTQKPPPHLLREGLEWVILRHFDIQWKDPAQKACDSLLSPTCVCCRCGLIPGVQEAVVICLNKQTREAADQSLCVSSRRPPQILQDCRTQPCLPRYAYKSLKTEVVLICSLSKVVCALNCLGTIKKFGGSLFWEQEFGCRKR